MKSLKSSFFFLFICFIFNIGKSQSSEKTQIDNIFFELVLKDMGKDKKIDNFCDNSILSEIHSLRIELTATTFKNKNKSIPDDFLSLDISPNFDLGWNTGHLGKAYLIKKNNFKTRKPKWDHCNSVYYDKFLSELTYEDFVNQKWNFLSAMKNLQSLVIYINGSCEANLNNFTIFSNNTINLKDLMNLEEIKLNYDHPYTPKELGTVINRNLNKIIVFGNNNKLKNIINITYEQFSSLSNSSNLKNIRTLIFSHPIDTLLKMKKINKIDNLYLNISKNIVKNDTLMLDESFSVLNFVDTVNTLFLTTQIDFKRTTQFNLIFRNNTVINLLNLEGFKNDKYIEQYENRNKALFTLNIDISKYTHFLKFSDFQQPYGSWNSNTQGYTNYFIPTKLKLSLNTFQLGNYQNPNILFPKIKESSANMPTTYWFEINHIKTESEKTAELEQIKIQKEIKRKEEEFNNSLLSKKHDSKIKTIFDKIINEVVEKKLVQKDISQLIMTQHEKLGESIGHKLTEDESKYFYKLIGEYTKEYQKQIELYNLLYSNKNSINSQGSTNNQPQQQSQSGQGKIYNDFYGSISKVIGHYSDGKIYNDFYGSISKVIGHYSDGKIYNDFYGSISKVIGHYSDGKIYNDFYGSISKVIGHYSDGKIYDDYYGSKNKVIGHYDSSGSGAAAAAYIILFYSP